MPAVTTVNAKSIVETLEKEFVKNIKARNAARLVQGFYASDARFLPANIPIAVGTKQITQTCQAMFDNGVSDLKLTTVTADAHGDVIWATGTYQLTITPPGTQQRINDTGKYLTVFRKQANGDWRCVADAFNSDLPMPGAPGSN